MSNDKQEVKEETIEIPEVEEVVEQNIELADISTLPAAEQEMAKEHGIVPKEGEEKKTEESKDKKTTEEQKKSFEDIEKDEKGQIGNYSKNEQALYFKWKSDKKARQDAQAERDLTLLREKNLKTELEKAKTEGSLTVSKLDAINKLLAGDPDSITIEAIQEILKSNPTTKEDKDKPLTKTDLEQLQKEQDEKDRAAAESNKQFTARMQSLEEYGKENFENYDEIIDSAKEVIEGKVDLGVIDYKDLAKRFIEKVNDKTNDPEDVAEFVVGMAKLNPNFGKKKEEGKKDDTAKGGKKVSSEQIDKIVKNATKGNTTVTSGGNNRRVVNINDITVEDAAKLTTEQYRALPQTVRERLRKEAM